MHMGKKQYIQLAIFEVILIIGMILSYVFNAPIIVKVLIAVFILMIALMIPFDRYDKKQKDSYLAVKIPKFKEYIDFEDMIPITENDPTIQNKIITKNKVRSSNYNNIIIGTYKEKNTTISQYSIEFDLPNQIQSYAYYNGFRIKIETDINVDYDILLDDRTDIDSLPLNDTTKKYLKKYIKEIGVSDDTTLLGNIFMYISSTSIEVFIDGFHPFSYINTSKKYQNFIDQVIEELDNTLTLINVINS